MGGVLAALGPIQIAAILVKAGTYVSVLLAAGSVINLRLLTELDAIASRRLMRLATGAALVGIVLGALSIPLRAAFLYGGMPGATDAMMLEIALLSPLGLSVEAGILGLLAIAAVGLDREWTGPVSMLGVVLVAVSFALRGHATEDPRLALSVLFVIHVLAASFWIGGFFPLYDMAGRGNAAAVRTVERFGRAALVVVGLLVGAGGVILVILAGDPIAVLAQPWGQFLALKLVAVAVLLGLAALNKLHLTPELARTGDGTALRTSIRYEIAVFAAILIVTATFTSTVAPGGM
ncbi:CopD family protein [Paracoccus sp. 1_MG-2023]|uniref:copper resistance D family protein n=1 Tax=unclassified Paracoccus (in: a-proteobacteria) TaxID=2688777 RepID=UPI001C08F441|nr:MULTISPECIES: CopD family protein [unclassified Paracoccus (in: a-proteobacteria)]MBU2959168.1 CopD family protein [Paracoccus sp. C2R09]MDO6670095.1 CopD family protein [Paracoccus sp. 1_MG-2023]